MGDRCTGDCCRAFVLSITHGELLRGYDSWRAGGKDCIRHGGGKMGIPSDAHIVALMVRPLGEFTANPLTGTPFNRRKMVYSCVHLGDNGDCGIYDRRPSLCRSFPGDCKCEYPGCTWDHAKGLPPREDKAP